MTSKTQKTGALAENLAEQFLVTHGLTILTRNFRSRFGEIDIIALHGPTLVFVEVRNRQNTRFGEAYETVTRSKQSKIIKTAMFFLQMKKQYNDYPMRFDVIGLTDLANTPRIDWIENAFDASN